MEKRSPGKKLFICMMVLSAVFASLGQLAFKIGVGAGTSLLFIVVGFIGYAISTLLYLYILSRTHLGWVYSMGGLSYVFTVILATLVLGEPANLLRWVGVLIIAVGAVFVGRS